MKFNVLKTRIAGIIVDRNAYKMIITNSIHENTTQQKVKFLETVTFKVHMTKYIRTSHYYLWSLVIETPHYTISCTN